MAERPILFSAPMVRALLAGTKTQTRRVAKVFVGRPELDGILRLHPHQKGCPYGAPGDTLWVKETWRSEARYDYLKPTLFPDGALVSYDADYSQEPNDGCRGKTRVSLHMQKRFSRLTLKITDVRVERLNDISEADAKAEGITEHPCTGPYRGPDATYWTADGPEPGAPIKRTTPVSAYKALWEEINGDESWDANPWVWAVSFEVVRG